MYFKDIVGLHDVKTHLIDSVNEGHIPHARMLYGATGVGKLPLAIAYARYLNCENRGETDSCGICSSCQKIDKLAHPDLHFVYPVVKSRVSDDYLTEWREFLDQHTYFDLNDWLAHIDAENAQAVIYSKESDVVIRKLNLKVYEARYKVMIIWLPEKMNEAGANRLLKLIEEPPQNTVFLLITEALEKNLVTIRSRCQPLKIPRIAQADLQLALQQAGVSSDEAAASIAHVANGDYLKALRMIRSEGESKELLELFKEMMRASVSRDIAAIRKIADTLGRMGREVQKSFLLNTLRLFREYFISNLNEPEMVYLNSEELAFGKRFAPFINETNIQQFDDEFQTAFRQISQNGNARIIFLDLCLKSTVLLKR